MIHNISNEFLSLSVKSFGAEICSLKKVGIDKEYIWQADCKYWARHAPILFPIVGRVKNDSFTYENNNYHLTQHGFARDMEFELHESGDDFLIFRLCSNKNTLIKYPFRFELYIEYELNGSSLNISYKVKNTDTKTIYFSIGSHIAFNCDILNDNSFFIEFDNINTTKQYILNDGIINSTRTFNFSENKIRLNKELFCEDALIFNDERIKRVSLKGNDFNLTYEFSDFPYLGIWSKPTGAPFVCIEPWCGIADFKNTNGKIEEKRGINSLGVNKVFEVNQKISL